MDAKVIVLKDADTVATTLAQTIADKIIANIEANKACKILLSGGKTPIQLYKRLALYDLPWKHIYLFWSDERFVPSDSPESNYLLVKQTILDSVKIPNENIHAINTSMATKDEAARAYEDDLYEFFGIESPFFDITILGIGEDGHVASLFPGSFALREHVRLAVSVTGAKLPKERITLTLPVLNSSAHIYVLATGEQKAEALKRILKGIETIDTCPAVGINPKSKQLEWWIDEEAAKIL